MSQPAPSPIPLQGPRLVAAQAGAAAVAARPAASPAPASVSSYIELEIEARAASDLDALRVLIVNASRKIASYDQALLAEPAPGGGLQMTRASSVHKIDPHSPSNRALSRWIDAQVRDPSIKTGEPRFANITEGAEDAGLGASDFPLPYAFWLPLNGHDGRLRAVLLALKSEPWQPQSTALLMPLAGAYAHAWEALESRRPNPAHRLLANVSRKKLAAGLTMAGLLALFVPVPMSALAPAEVVARDPAIITAPMDGVVEKVHSPPGAHVEAGAPLLNFVDVKLKSDHDIARRNAEVARARYFKLVQSATANQKDMAEVAVAKTEFDVANAEAAYAATLLERSRMTAPLSGYLIYSAASDWAGRPVRTGERILEIGDPATTEVRIEVPVSDAISLMAGGRVQLFPDGDPLNAIDAEIVRTAYRPEMNAERQLVYRVTARFADGEPRRIGLRGIARVNAGHVPLWFYLFRRPIAALRQRMGV